MSVMPETAIANIFLWDSSWDIGWYSD